MLFKYIFACLASNPLLFCNQILETPFIDTILIIMIVSHLSRNFSCSTAIFILWHYEYTKTVLEVLILVIERKYQLSKWSTNKYLNIQMIKIFIQYILENATYKRNVGLLWFGIIRTIYIQFYTKYCTTFVDKSSGVNEISSLNS